MDNPSGLYRRLLEEREKLAFAGRIAEAALARGDQSATADCDAIGAEMRRVDAAIDQVEAEHRGDIV